MLGPAKPRHLNDPVAVSLEDLVPIAHFYRHLETKLDLSFVREWTRELYADRGRPSIDPVVFFKLQLVMFFEVIRSERQLIETASLNLAHRWYLGYALHEALPDHSSLTRIRQRLGIDVFQRFFERVVDLCQAAGMVWGKELFFDATKIEANADLNSLMPRFFHEAKGHIAELFADDGSPPDEVSPEEAAVDDLPAGVIRLQREPAAVGSPGADPPWRLLEERRLDPHREAAWGYERTSAWRVSTTDPDATPMRTKHGTKLGYHDHYVVDGGKHRIILAALVTPADVMENVPMRDLLWRVCFRRKIWPHHVTGDTTYGTTENIVAIEEAGIRAYVPLPDLGSRRPQFFAQTAFTYDAERDEYRCPQHRPLERETAKYGEEVVVPCPGRHLQHLSTQAEMHGKSAWPHRPSVLLRRLPGDGARPSRDCGLPEGDAQAASLGGAALRRGQGLAWVTSAAIAGPGEREHPGTVDRHGPEPEAVTEQMRLGTAPMAPWSA